MLYLELFLTYFKIGLFTIGGGYAMVPMITQEVVTIHGWLTMQELTDFIGIAESTPGPFAINTATFVGNKIGGVLGSLCTTTGVVLPSLIIIVLIAKIYARFKENTWVRAGLSGMSCVVLGLIAAAIFLLLREVYWLGIDVTIPVDWRAIAITAIGLVLNLKLKLKPIPLIAVSAALGLLLYGVLPMLL